MADAAHEAYPLQSAVVNLPAPTCFAELGMPVTAPVRQTHTVYSVQDVTVTGWKGAMIKDGLLLSDYADCNWAAEIRLRPYFTRVLPDGRAYFNLMTSIPARGHVFHWLFDSILPFVAFAESGKAGNDIGLIVNAKLSEIQARTIEFLKTRYPIRAVEPVSEAQAVFVPHCQKAVAIYGLPHGLQSPAALQALDGLARFLAGAEAHKKQPARIYISRNDARLRRVLNEGELLRELHARGFERTALGRMPLARQVALFINAEFVAAPHGAGLTHIAWCKPGTRVAEFFPEPRAGRKVRNYLPDFWCISSQRGLSHSCHFGAPVETRADGFRIPREALAQALGG